MSGGDALERMERALADRTEELRRANEMLARFAYVASHDLREPLRTIASFVALLGRRYRGRLDADADELIRFAVDGVDRMRTLLDGLLAYAEVGSDAHPFAAFDSGAVCARAIAHLRESIDRARGCLCVGPLPTVYGNEAQIAYVLQHLIGNAVKFRSDAVPRVQIRAERDDAFWRFSVSDNGIGIAPDQIQRLFRMFFRLEPAKYPGAGASLAICQEIVHRHGGRMWADSAPGQGTTFYFTLPALEKPI